MSILRAGGSSRQPASRVEVKDLKGHVRLTNIDIDNQSYPSNANNWSAFIGVLSLEVSRMKQNSSIARSILIELNWVASESIPSSKTSLGASNRVCVPLSGSNRAKNASNLRRTRTLERCSYGRLI